MKIIIGSDHAGYKLKKALVRFFTSENKEIDDIGTDSEDSVDYPDYGIKVAQSVANGAYDKGILICGSGVGMSIVANKIVGVRAALVMTPEQAELSKKHNNANILVLAGRFTDEKTAIDLLRTWLETSFEGGRHAKRVQKIHDLAEK